MRDFYSGALTVKEIDFDIPEQRIGNWTIGGQSRLFLRVMVVSDATDMHLYECIGQTVLDGLKLVDMQVMLTPESHKGYPVTLIFGV